MNRLDQRRRLDALKSTISLADLVERDGHKLTRVGSLMKLCCPFHRERTPSCVIYPDSHAHCFGCDAHFDVFQYVMQRDGCGFKEAVEKLEGGAVGVVRKVNKLFTSKKPDPVIPAGHFHNMHYGYRDPNLTPELNDIAAKLDVSPVSLISLAVMVTPDGNLSFPMRDHLYNVVGIRLRDSGGRKWAVKGSKQGLFLPIFSCYECPPTDLYVTEGPTDCAAMLSMGLFAIGKAAAMQGPEEIVKFIVKNRIRRVIVIADNDTAGLRGAKKLIEVCPVPCCELVLPAKDAREFYRNGGTRELVEALLRSAVWRTPKHAKMDQ